MNSALNKKIVRLKNIISKMDSVVVAFSAGVDSSLLLKVAKDILDKRVIAVTVRSSLIPEGEINEAVKLANKLKVKHRLLNLDLLKIKPVSQNSQKRCYFCKKKIMQELSGIARKSRFKYVVDGSNADDLKSLRPGKKALTELGIRSPLTEAGLSKPEIRAIARQLNLENWSKTSSSCLATRLPYGTTLTKTLLRRIDRAENVLKGLGFAQVRVRTYRNTACIELEKSKISRFARILDKKLIDNFKNLGYKKIYLDLTGYLSGKMDLT